MEPELQTSGCISPSAAKQIENQESANRLGLLSFNDLSTQNSEAPHLLTKVEPI